MKEIKDELEFVGRFMEKNHADIMRMIETTKLVTNLDNDSTSKCSVLVRLYHGKRELYRSCLI